MFKKLLTGFLIYRLTAARANEAELPLCPTNVLYFPQNLPMHCRMPTNADVREPPGSIPTVPPFYQNLPLDKQPQPIPIPVPPGVPGPMPMPGPMSMPGPMGLPGPMPGPMGLPGPMPGSMVLPGPMPFAGGPSHKLPVIVMPFYSPDPSFKKTERPNMQPFRPKKWRIRHKRRRPYYYSSSDSSTDTDTSSDTSTDLSSSEHRGWWRNRRNRRRFNGARRINRKHKQRRQLLTPVLQYQTKDGYVIFEKKITKNEAKDWLKVKADDKVNGRTRLSPEGDDMESGDTQDNQSREKEVVTEDIVEVITKRNSHQLNKIKAYKNKAARKKIAKQQI